ncbi:MAG: histidine kinase [Micrococcales bacterium]|nr:histidine kinase [Micrococcales bacterium]
MTTGAPYSPPPTAPGGARWKQGLRSVQGRTWLLYFPICFVTSVLAISTWDVRGGATPNAPASGPALLLWLLGLITAASLVCRRRFPEMVSIATSLVALLLPLDPVPALIAFGSATVRRLDQVTAALAALLFAATTASTWRDSRGTSTAASFWQMLRAEEGATGLEPLALWVVLAISSALVAITFGVAMLIRDRAQASDRRESDAAQQVVVDSLSDEVARQAERERIAREVHDALGHRLSMLSLHAGALEMTAGDDQRLAQSAALVRANAQQSMADLRHLLATLQTPEAPDVATAVPTLRDVAALVDETLATGVTVVSTIQLESVERLDLQTSRSAYRLTQELLTNARKHAPGLGVRVLVRATPGTGVDIELANRVPAGGGATVRPGRGLTGAQTRVEQLAGEWRCWVDDDGVFRAAAHLPWVWSEAGAATDTGGSDTGGADSRRGDSRSSDSRSSHTDSEASS